MPNVRVVLRVSLLAAGVGAIAPKLRLAQDPTRATLNQIKREIKALSDTLERTRATDREEIQRLERRVDQLEGENHRLKASVAQTDEQMKGAAAQTSQAIKQIQSQSEKPASISQFSQTFQQYLGSHTFQVAGGAALEFVYDQQSGALDGFHHATQNSYFFDWEPLILYRPTDWIAFVGELEGAFGQAGASTSLPLADFQIFLDDRVELVAGLFDQPFGDWYEAQSPIWVNRFVSAPLPFGVEPVVPPSEIGLQARGGFQWGQLGQDFDYTVWTGNGPGFSETVPGAVVGSPIPIASKQTNGKAFGGRLRFYPIEVDANLGRLELGASTYNGKWFEGKWFNSWGIDFNYFNGNLQSRGEWVQAYRQMTSGLPTDNRQGWYLQFGYFLRNLKVPLLPNEINGQITKLEPVIRYSGVNQHSVALDDISAVTGVGVGGIQAGLIPDLGLSGSPVLFAPHSREVALGLDYWLAPSIVWKNEFDLELPRGGGTFVHGSGATQPVGSVPNDHAFLSQFTIGF